MLFTQFLLVQVVVIGSFAATVGPIDFTTPDLIEMEQPIESNQGDAFSTEFVETTTAQQPNVTQSATLSTAWICVDFILSTLKDDLTETTVTSEPIITNSIASTQSGATQSLTTVASSTLTTEKNSIVTVGVTASSAHLIASFATLLLSIL